MKRFFASIVLILCLVNKASSQTSVALSPVPAQQFLSSTGVPLSGGCVYTFISQTSTPLPTFTDSTGTTQSPNPVILDAGGFASGIGGTGGLWLSNSVYRFQIWSFGSGAVGSNCGNGTLQRTIDGVSAYTIINQSQNLFLAGASSDPGGTAGEMAYRTDIPCFRFFTTFWDCVVRLTDTQTLTNKTIDISANTLKNSTNTAGHYPRNSGAQYIDSTIQPQDVPGASSVIPSNGVNPPVLNSLAKLANANLLAVTATVTDTFGIVGICIASCGTATEVIQQSGLSTCNFDGGTSAGDYIQISSTVAGDCHDTSSAVYPTTGGQVIGRVTSAQAGAGAYQMFLFGPEVRPSTLAAAVNVTAVGANIVSTPILTPAANGYYRASCYVVLTQAATTSSTLPVCNILYTDADTGIVEGAQSITATSNANVVGTYSLLNGTTNMFSFFAKLGASISYSTTAYASVGATPMQYAIHIRLEGPL